MPSENTCVDVINQTEFEEESRSQNQLVGDSDPPLIERECVSMREKTTKS
ncbi:hypothetical protein FDUTEX481_06486 [Tolypothrix sp. PCC 7601]|nr:hypothetical protein FDUTEX481_06486 [Tolypothrix sp. PCC 7601]